MNSIRTWHVSNRDMLLFRKSSIWGCYQPGHVTKRDVFLLATLRYWSSNSYADSVPLQYGMAFSIQSFHSNRSCPAVQKASSTSQESGPTTLCTLFTKVISDGILILPHHPYKKLFLCLLLLQFSTCCMSSKVMDHNKVRMRLKVS